jgi:hypothetical protein
MWWCNACSSVGLTAQAASSVITSSLSDSVSVFCSWTASSSATLSAEVAPADEPLVVLLDQERSGEADGGCVVGEDPDDV